jgi:hypothetical protein
MVSEDGVSMREYAPLPLFAKLCKVFVPWGAFMEPREIRALGGFCVRISLIELPIKCVSMALVVYPSDWRRHIEPHLGKIISNKPGAPGGRESPR